MALVLCLPCAQAYAQQSPRPVPKQEQAQPARPEQPADRQQQAAPQPPIVVNVVPAPKTEKELAEERHEREEKAKLDKRLVDLTAELSDYTGGLYRATVVLAVATGLLVLVTAGLVIFAWRQAGDMKKSIEISSQSAKAAEDSAATADNALRTTQRAYIGVEPDGIRPHRRKREGAPVGAGMDLTGHFFIKNVGHLPARELSWCVGIKCEENRRWRPPTDIPDDKFVGDNMVVTPGTSMRRATSVISSVEFKRPKYCYIWGQVRYRDGLGNQRTTNFCHRYNCEALLDDQTIPEEHARYHEYGNDGT